MNARRLAVALLWLVAACAGEPAADAARSGPAAISDVTDNARRDTALLSAASVRIGGFTSEPVQLGVWRDTWVAPARIALDVASTEVLGSIVEGRVVNVYVSPGDRVQRGQVLVAIHSHEIMDARASVARANAAMSHTESELRMETTAAERAERLFNIKALSLADLERARGRRIEAQTQLDAAKAEHERADAFLDHLVGNGPLPRDYDEHWVLIRAPLTGQIVSRSVQPGNVVLVGATLLAVSETSALTLIAQLPEGASSAVTDGARIQFTVEAYGDHRFTARVIRVLPNLDSVTRTVEVQAAIVADRAKPLRAEMFASAEIEGGAAGRVRSVPLVSVQTIDGVQVVIESERRGEALLLSAVPVRVGRRTRDRAEVLAGTDTGRSVVVEGAAIAKAELIKRRGGS